MKTRRHFQARRAAGFTLIELIISGALMTLILASGYLCLQAGFSAQRLIDPRLDAMQGVRVVLTMIAADLRSACPLSEDAEFVGMDRTLGEVEADNVDFATHHCTPRGEGSGDYCQVSYFVERDARTGRYSLWRRRNPRIGLDPFSGGTREELLEGVRQLKFEYYDGFEWYDTWGDADGGARRETSNQTAYNLYGMPEAVRITLGVEAEKPRGGGRDTETDRAPPLVFQTVARLNLAARSAASGSTTGPGTAGGSGGVGGGGVDGSGEVAR